MEVTVSGMCKQRRSQLQSLVERLRGTYSGALVVGRTAVVVVEGAAVDFSAPKLAVARSNGIPIVSSDWLTASAEHGFLLSVDKFIQQPPGRRSSACSTSAGVPWDTGAAASLPEPFVGPSAPATLPAASGRAQDVAATVKAAGSSLLAAAAAAGGAPSPSPEKLRGEACPPVHSPLAAPFMERAEDAAVSPVAAPAGRGLLATLRHKQQVPEALVPDDLQVHHLPSLASPPAAAAAPLQTHEQPSPLVCSPLHWSPGGIGPDLDTTAISSSPVLVPAEGDGSRHPAAAHGLRGHSPLAAVVSSAGLLRTHVGQQSAAAAAAAAVQATPAPAGNHAGGTDTDSDTKVARFLSRAPLVTLVRGGGMSRRPCYSDSDSGSSSGNAGASMHTASNNGSGKLPGSCDSSCSASQGTNLLSRLALQADISKAGVECQQPGHRPEQQQQPEHQPEQQRQPAGASPAAVTWPDEAGGQLAHGTATATGGPSAGGEAGAALPAGNGSPGGLAGSPLLPPAAAATQGRLHPAPPTILRRWYTESVMRMRPSQAASHRLPATTLIRLGPPLQHPPARSTLDGIAERHHMGALDVGRLPVSFYSSAQALPEGGQEMRFVAGDSLHGARILYDILEGGQRIYALTLIQNIYRLYDEAWMEHRYLLSRQDLEERPGWKAALQGHTIKDDEVLLSACCYHSPMHLISGEFWLRFPGRVRLAGQGQGQAGSPAAGRQIFACRKGFDAAAKAVVPLRRALNGFAPVV